ncbi:MAG: carboxymuconolactone decarboxylase family protein [Micromonosporaceae bacterium]
MRLDILDHGHRMRARWFLAAVRLSGTEMSDVIKALLYRPEFLGRALLDLTPEAMRGRSYWTAGEREFIAMSTSELNRCPFCAETHTQLIRLASDGEIDAADPDSARPELVATLGFIDTVTRQPDTLTDQDLAAVRAAGVPDSAVDDALGVNVVFNIVNRLANAFDFQLKDGQLVAGTRALHRIGYRMPGVLTRTRSRTPVPARVGPGRYASHVAGIRSSVFDSPGETPPELRAAAGNGAEVPPRWRSYVAKVREKSYQVTDADIEDLKTSGCTEDEILEMTIAAAVGPALHSFDAGYAAIQRSRPAPYGER